MVFAALVLLAVTQVPDTSSYANVQTARLIARARERHQIQDTLVHDYEATVRTRIDAGFGRSRFAHIVPLAALETAARITWARPNDLHVKIIGVRSATTIRGAKIDGSFSNPWFVPRGLGDSIRFVDQELPETPALHPLAPSGDEFYRFAIFDSLAIQLPDRKISAIGVRVQPKRTGPSLIAGNLWLDAETAEVVRMTFTYLGQFLWSTPDSATRRDSAKAIRDNEQANRILKVDAELEYALHESRYWMPYRQLVTLTVDIPVFLNATVPVRFVTTFSDYQLNRGVVPQFTIVPAEQGKWGKCRREVQDTTCAELKRSDRHPEKGFIRAQEWDNGHWELEMPPKDSLATYAWPDQLALQPDAATDALIRETTETLAKMEQTLPPEWVAHGVSGVALERFSDLFRFNRVQGPSVGGGYQFRTRGFNSFLVSGRFGISDKRPTGALTFRREAPSGRLDISAWRSIREVEPWTRGSTFGNSLNALFAAHDDADYYLGLGGGISFLGNNGLARDLSLDLHFEHATSITTQARSALNDVLGGSGFFPPNASIRQGDFLAASASRRTVIWPLDLQYGADGLGGLGSGASGVMSGRLWMSARVKFDVVGRGMALSARTSTAIGDDVPQMQFRVGGPESVRGYDYGFRRGRSGWAAQADLALTRGIVTPVVFADAGNTFTSDKPLLSVGGGVSILDGMIRFNISGGLQPTTGVRFDLLFRAAR